MSVTARIVTSVGDFHLDAQLACAPGETVALLGPNGAGKSMIVKAIAGLQPIERGCIRIDSTPVDEPASTTFIPPEHRRVGVVFQDYLLFPHMSVRQNIEFGPRNLKVTGTTQPWIERLDLTELLERKPAQLSGGQSQRVAIARALATNPRALLLDEPLAALDAATKQEVRGQLRHFLTDFEHGTILVTHDPLDALVLADRIVVVEDGRVTQQGPTAEVASQPRTDYLAKVLGVNLLRGDVYEGVMTPDGGGSLVVSTDLEGPAVVVIRPQAITLHAKKPEGSARNVWESTVLGIETHHDQVRVALSGPPELTAAVTHAAVADLKLVPGQRVWMSLKATDTDVHPA
ncbi:MAG: ABC transporter ATP-binding protein [Candidatus Nanopelagicales bacterium]|nr:ABC transporter ATP-binding protein [Candidatus Nanopelagicales bacterium]NKB91333.1 ATP-binding cassette domain-containing protein [Candidatus Nanopelagicales bacterium]